MKWRTASSTTSDMAMTATEVAALCKLVGEAQKGDRRAAERLVRENEGWVRSVIYGVTGRPDMVDDIAQQVWAQVWTRLDSLNEPRRLRSWLYTVARNAAIDMSQAARRRRAIGLDDYADTIRDERARGPVGRAVGSELRQTLLRAVESLPALYREPFVLRHLEDWSYAQIGALLDLSVETVETRLVRARRLLREALKGVIDGPEAAVNG